MKVEVWKDTKTKEEKVLRLRLIQESSCVTLKAVNVDGKPIPGCHLANISPDGIYIVGSVSEDAGIALDKDERMVVTNARS